MQEIMNFEGNDVEVIQNENGEPLFEVYDINFLKTLDKCPYICYYKCTDIKEVYNNVPKRQTNARKT